MPLKKSVRQNIFRPDFGNSFIVRPFLMRSTLFLTVGENKSDGTIYMIVRVPYLKWQPVKTRQLVYLDKAAILAGCVIAIFSKRYDFSGYQNFLQWCVTSHQIGVDIKM